MNLPTQVYQKLLIWLLASTLAVSAVFTSFPQLDIFVSALFYRQGFWLGEIPALEWVRQILIWFMYVVALGSLGAMIWAMLRRRPAKSLKFAVVSMLLGPILLVNGILKTYWGRARPIEITEFGGEKTFTPVYYFSDQCPTNCSFTSGEGGAIAAVAIVIGFLAWPYLASRGRRVLGGALVALVVLGAGLRVAVGGHFLSDTLLSILFTALVAALVYRWFFPARDTDSQQVENAK